MNGRRIFIKSTVAASLASLGWLSFKAVNDDSFSGSSKKTVTLDAEIPYGFSLYGPFAVYRTQNDFKVFSSVCTHLGCRINKVDGSQLVCPCHGSKFNPDGSVAEGPATKGLKQLKHYFVNGKLTVELESDGF